MDLQFVVLEKDESDQIDDSMPASKLIGVDLHGSAQLPIDDDQDQI